MALDRYTLAIFGAGVLAGLAMAITAYTVTQGLRLLRFQLRRRRRPAGEPKPLDRAFR